MRYTFIYIISALFFANTSTAQDTLTRFLDENLELTEEQDKASFSADVYKKDNLWQAIIYYGTGNIAANGSYRDKKLKIKQGWFTFYYSATGRKMYQVHYDNNYQTDTWRSWYENGRIRDSGKLDDGKKTGYWQTWHSNGNLAATGSFTTTYPMVIPGYEGTFPAEKRERRALFLHARADVRTGLWKTWYRNGQIKDSLKYSAEGLEEGIGRSWYDNGQLESVGTYAFGKSTGAWEWFHPNGNKATIEQYVNGKVNSMQCFDTAGTLTGDYCSVYKDAMFPGGTIAFEDYLKKNLRYPERAGRQTGMVEMGITIGTNGKPIAVDIDSSPSNYFSQEAERLIYEMPVWEPAISHNRAVPYNIAVKLAFTPPK